VGVASTFKMKTCLPQARLLQKQAKKALVKRMIYHIFTILWDASD